MTNANEQVVQKKNLSRVFPLMFDKSVS